MPRYIITEDNRKFDLEKTKNLDISTREEHGVKITSVHKTRSGKIIVGTYSIWASSRNDGTVVGQEYHVADADEIASLAKRFDDETLMAMVPAED